MHAGRDLPRERGQVRERVGQLLVVRRHDAQDVVDERAATLRRQVEERALDRGRDVPGEHVRLLGVLDLGEPGDELGELLELGVEPGGAQRFVDAGGERLAHEARVKRSRRPCRVSRSHCANSRGLRLVTR